MRQATLILVVLVGFGMMVGTSRRVDRVEWSYGTLSTFADLDGTTQMYMVGITPGSVAYTEYPEGHSEIRFKSIKTFTDYLKANVDEFQDFAPPSVVTSATPPEELAKFYDETGSVNLIGKLGWELFQVDVFGPESRGTRYWFKRPR